MTVEPDALVDSYFQAYVAGGRRTARFVLRHPRRSVQMLLAAGRLPALTAPLGDTSEGRLIREALARRSPWFGRTVLHRATAVLVLPARAEDYSVGHAKQTLRRKVRAAQRLGVQWREVTDPAERQRLVCLAHENERTFPLEPYRHLEPDLDNLLDCRLWLVALAADGRPVLLSTTAIDGDWALLRYFRVLGVGPEQSNARFLMTQVLVQHLVERGVRHLADEGSPVGLENGLRQYQRLLGFRLVQLRLTGRHPRGLLTRLPSRSSRTEVQR